MRLDAARFTLIFSAILMIGGFAGACGANRGDAYGDNDGANNGDGSAASGSLGSDGAAGGGSESGGGTSGPVCNDAPCACAAAGGSWDGTKCTLSENPGSVSVPTQTALAGGGTSDSAFKFLYPYDKTIFPRGLLPPTLQLDGAAATAMLVHITAPTVDYTGYFGSSSPTRATPSQAAWAAITLAATATDAIKVDVTKISGSAVTGPVTENWNIAQGSMRGVIYYETYGSAILGGFASVGIMKINPGASTPTKVASGCGNVCHTASADGSTLVSAAGFGGITSVSYNLKGSLAIRKSEGSDAFVYGGLTPDGSLAMSSTNYRTWTGAKSKLYDTTSGANVSAPGWDNVVSNASMPAFSPDGSKIVFNHEDSGNGHSLAVMNYASSSHTFSGLTDVASDSGLFLGWPAFTPDATAVVYHAGNNNLFETDGTDEAGATSSGDLYSVDLASHTKARLDTLDGYSGAGTYLPASDPNLNFAPTILPEAVGGYFWVVFTSHRSYGNTLPSKDNSDTNGKLWVAALDIGAPAGTDNSHPAFYLDGQESTADNLRGFWVLDPCEDDNNGCTSGDQCCGGYCEPNASGALACTSTPPSCSKEFEKCGSGAPDCCSGLQCIDGKCATPPPR